VNVTLFFGAGFSAAFGHPVMDEFLGFADSCKSLDDGDRTFLGKLVLEARRANSFLENSPTNIEDILSFSEMGERLRLTEEGEDRNRRLRSIIQRIYTSIPPAKDYWERFRSLENLLGRKPLEFAGSLSLITTNYDLNIESACASLGARVDPGFELRRITDGYVQVVHQCYAEAGISLSKLHGSVNWYASEEEPGIKVDDRVVRVGDLFEEAQRSLPYPCAGDYQPPDVPILVPPSFLKPDLIPALKAVWRRAADALSKTNILAFIGYSFPQSDTEMMYFLARSLAENAGLRRVYIVDPAATRIVDRLRDRGGKVGSHLRSLLEPIPQSWQTTSLPL
jgi:hypothetical protein